MPDRKPPVTYGFHQARIAEVRYLADALAVEDVIGPKGSVSRFVEEGFLMLIGCREHFPAIAVAGATERDVEVFKKILFALQSAEAIWQARVLLAGEGECSEFVETAAAVRDRIYTLARDVASTLRSQAALAFRDDDDDTRRAMFLSRFERRRGWGFRTRRGFDEVVELGLKMK